ncbi:MAG: PepSY domain-containing protein [Gammaproteobacteria bacterium]|nr:PepSY domain-containing protein [Gammaproteobacteria bacterium]
MMKNSLKLIVTGLLIFLSTPLFADDDHDEAKRLMESGEILALEVVLKKAREIQAGKVLEVELESENNNMIYEIELLSTDGIVFELKFDARTGKHLSTEKEN